MTTENLNLSDGQKELVAVGASVGAGCHPCVSHHLKAGAKAGLDGEQLLAAIVSAERVGAEASVAMGDHARGKLGPTVTSPALLPRLEEALISLGAALGANDKTNIERQLHAASELGATRAQLQQAIETAHTVQENAARIHLREAKRLLEAVAPATTAGASDAGAVDQSRGCGRGNEVDESRGSAAGRVSASNGDEPDGSCGCGADGKAEESPVPLEQAEPATATSGQGCREMFERLMFAAPATSEQAPPATTASGLPKKEAR